MFKRIENLKELYREHPYTQHLDSTNNILLYLFYHVSIHSSIYTDRSLFSRIWEGKALDGWYNFH